jgi:hypothetical protein
VRLKQAEPLEFFVLTRFDELDPQSGEPNGKGYSHIYRLSPDAQQPEQLKKLSEPVLTGQQVKDDWLLLTLKGELFCFRISDEKLRKLKRPRFAYTDFLYSPQEERAALISSPVLKGSAEQKQLLIYE